MTTKTFTMANYNHICHNIKFFHTFAANYKKGKTMDKSNIDEKEDLAPEAAPEQTELIEDDSVLEKMIVQNNMTVESHSSSRLS
jgi:hypothetical protein